MIGRNSRVMAVVSMIALTAYFDYATAVHRSSFDVIYRELYLLPIFLGAWWFGKKGGLITSLGASAAYLPCAMLGAQAGSALFFSNIFEVGLFNLLGFLVGHYSDLRRRRFAWSLDSFEKEAPKDMHNILLCIERPENALRSARYVVDNFTWREDMSVTVLGIFRTPSPDIYQTEQEHSQAVREKEAIVSETVSRASSILVEGGFPAERVHTRILSVRHGRVVETLLEEQQRNGYDTIIVGCNKMSKAQEFLFGNLNVNLVREAPCPVLSVC